MVFKKWVENIQTAGYNGARTVCLEKYGVYLQDFQQFTT